MARVGFWGFTLNRLLLTNQDRQAVQKGLFCCKDLSSRGGKIEEIGAVDFRERLSMT